MKGSCTPARLPLPEGIIHEHTGLAYRDTLVLTHGSDGSDGSSFFDVSTPDLSGLVRRGRTLGEVVQA